MCVCEIKQFLHSSIVVAIPGFHQLYASLSNLLRMEFWVGDEERAGGRSHVARKWRSEPRQPPWPRGESCPVDHASC